MYYRFGLVPLCGAASLLQGLWLRIPDHTSYYDHQSSLVQGRKNPILIVWASVFGLSKSQRNMGPDRGRLLESLAHASRKASSCGCATSWISSGHQAGFRFGTVLVPKRWTGCTPGCLICKRSSRHTCVDGWLECFSQKLNGHVERRAWCLSVAAAGAGGGGATGSNCRCRSRKPMP